MHSLRENAPAECINGVETAFFGAIPSRPLEGALSGMNSENPRLKPRESFRLKPGLRQRRPCVDAGVKISDSAGEGASQVNRRISNQELRMSKAASGDPRLSFAVLRFGVLRFGRKKTKKKVSFGPAEAGTPTEAPVEPLAWAFGAARPFAVECPV